jgi:uracil-DNA glycosylase family 4
MSLITLTGCDVCPLKKEWQYLKHPRMLVTPPTRPSDFRILVIGEGPGASEDSQGKQFVGPTGQYLRKYLPLGWEHKVHWSNIVHCRPPNNATPTPQECKACSIYTDEDLERIKPHAILGLGQIPLDYFWPGQNITNMRGITFPVKLRDGSWTWFMGTFHPSYVVRGDKRTRTSDYHTESVENYILPVFRNDLKKFFAAVPELAKTPPKILTPPTKEQVVFPKSKQEAQQLLARMKRPFAMDFETYKKKPYERDARLLASAFSDGDLTISFPGKWPGFIDCWGEDVVVEFLANLDDYWIAHYAPFELAWAWFLSKNNNLKFHDTLALARLVYHRKGILSLETQSIIHLGVDIKTVSFKSTHGGDVKFKAVDILDYPQEVGLYYNAKDAWADINVFHCLKPDADQRDNYKRIIATTKSTVTMELMGIPVDMEESGRQYEYWTGEQNTQEELAKRIPEVIAWEKKESKVFRLSANQDVAGVLVNHYHLSLPKSEKNQSYLTDEKILEKFVGNPVVDCTLLSREYGKVRSTYVEPIFLGYNLGADNLLHPAYTPSTLTWTGRLSSEDPNIQNWPVRKHKEVRKQIIAPPGFVITAFDYGQLEARSIQWGSGDQNLKKALASKPDLHWKWLYRLLEVYPDYKDHLAQQSGETEYNKILKAGRTIIKTDFVFSSFYGSQSEAVASVCGIPVDTVKKLHAEFWGEYPNVLKWQKEVFQFYKEHGYIKTLTNFKRDGVVPGNEPTNNEAQGTGSHVVLEAQNALKEAAFEYNDLTILPRINVHDCLYFFLPDSSELEGYIKLIGEVMVVPRFKFITCPLTVEASIGYDWGNLEEVAIFSGEYYEKGVLTK